MSGDREFNLAARKHYRRHAEMVERAGDAVGANDPALANDLWEIAGRVRAYADRFTVS